MQIEKGNIVILTDTDQPKLHAYIGTKWVVQAVLDHIHPNSAMIYRDGMQATAYIKHLEVVPPPESIFEHGEVVKINKAYSKTNHRTCDKTLIGKTGKIRSYDSRTDFYFVRCVSGEFGWFPQTSLIPIDFKGQHFFYPLQQVKYHDAIVTINYTKRTKFNYGQLLEIEGQWIPSTEVEPLDRH